MSAARPSRRSHTAIAEGNGRKPSDMSELRARRRQARRRRRLARLDLAIGVVGALVLLLISPGLAISGLVALIVLGACALSVVVERRRRAGRPIVPRLPRRHGRHVTTRRR